MASQEQVIELLDLPLECLLLILKKILQDDKFKSYSQLRMFCVVCRHYDHPVAQQLGRPEVYRSLIRNRAVAPIFPYNHTPSPEDADLHYADDLAFYFNPVPGAPDAPLVNRTQLFAAIFDEVHPEDRLRLTVDYSQEWEGLVPGFQPMVANEIPAVEDLTAGFELRWAIRCTDDQQHSINIDCFSYLKE